MSEKLGCKHCNYKGYTRTALLGGSAEEEGGFSVSVCSHCGDARGYYAYVKNTYGSLKNNVINLVEEEPTATVLDFNEFKQRRKKDTGE